MASKTKKRQLAAETAATVAKRNKGHNSTCPICEESFKPGHESIFCEGDCQKYLHRQCASLTKEQFKKAGESNLPFYCLHCILLRHNSEIDKLKKLVSELTAKIGSLEGQSSSASNGHTIPTESISVGGPSTTINQRPSPKTGQSDDRKYNLVVYGISECPNGTKRSERVKQDIVNSVSILSDLNNDIQANSIRDSLRLGKFKKDQTRPRPLLLKLNRVIDVITVLSNRSSLKDKSITVKPDMTLEERQIDSLLLKERWSLIQSGVDKSDIKIKSGSLFVKGKKHGYVHNSVFCSVNVCPPVETMDATSNSNSN